VLNKFLSTTSFVETNDRKEETDSVGFDKLRGSEKRREGVVGRFPVGQARQESTSDAARMQGSSCLAVYAKCRIQKETRLGFFREK